MNLKDRMKRYENVSKTKLMIKEPVIIRLDGKAFHTFTRGLAKPFDMIFAKVMHKTMEFLCKNIQGCILGFTESDEITLVLCDYEKLESQAWFDYQVQKLCSVSASMCTMAFNKFWIEALYSEELNTKRLESLLSKQLTAMFDARCFNIPKNEIVNMLIWRQIDGVRNSISSAGQAFFEQKKIHKKSCDELKDMLLKECNFNWDLLSPALKWGVCCFKEEGHWRIDFNTPLFKEDQEYINSKVLF